MILMAAMQAYNSGSRGIKAAALLEEKCRESKRMSGRKEKSVNNIWKKEDFQMCGLGEKSKFAAKIKHFKRCIYWSWQRITRGYAECDKWNMYVYLQNLVPEMLQDLRDNRMGSPGYLGENYTNKEGILVNDTCHAEWNKILDHMIFLWRESNEETCERKNPYDEEYGKAYKEFVKRYGLFGEKLQTEEELKESQKHGSRTMHFMDEISEFKEISEKYFAEDKELGKYRERCKNEAMDLLKEHFFALWD